MLVKAIKVYKDLELKRLVNAGEELNVTEARANKLIKAKVAVIIEAPPTPEVAIKAPKKAVTRKRK